MSLFGVEVNHQVNRIITETRLTLQKQKFIPNLRTLYRSFAQADQNISGVLPPNLFEKAVNQNGIFYKNVELTIIQKAFTADNGQISWFQFLQTLKVPLNEKRKALLSQIFAFLAGQHEKLTPENLLVHFDPSDIELVKSKKMAAGAAQEQLASLLYFADGQLTEQEFIAFYDDLNLNFPHDEPFIKYISKQWGFTPEVYPEAREEVLRQIIKALRFKLIQKSKGTNDEFLMRKLFNEFDENKNGFISAFELDLMLKKLELPIAAEQVEPLLRKLDRNQSGSIEYDEFKRFVFFDPFPA